MIIPIKTIRPISLPNKKEISTKKEAGLGVRPVSEG
jgi:hypothetical protein